MQLNSAFSCSELSPIERAQTKINSRRIKQEYLTIKKQFSE